MNEKNEIFISENDFRSRYQYSHADLLGEGGFAQVYKAYDKQFNEYVALKFYNKGEQGKYDVLHEMKDSRKFSHKNIVRVHDAFVVRFEHTGGYSLVQVGILEYANGGNLRDFMNSKPTESKFVEVLTGILSALEYLHTDKKIIHRDLSPENILMYVEDDNWLPKIADFGISKKLDISSDAGNSKKSTQLLGKVSYMAPEQFYPEKYGIRGEINTNVDLWAFGVILYELFTQRKPFGNDYQDNVIQIIQSITSEQLPNLDEIPERFRIIIRKCLLKDANKRVKSGGELISLLNNPTSHSGKQPRATMPVLNLVQNKRRITSILTGVIAVLGLSIAGYFFYHNRILSRRYAISTISGLVDEKKYNDAITFVKQLPSKLQLDKVIIDLYDQSERSNQIDSLLNISKLLMEIEKYDEALLNYNKIVTDLNPSESTAHFQINRINRILDSLKKTEETAPVAIKNEKTDAFITNHQTRASNQMVESRLTTDNRTVIDSSHIENQLSEAAGKIVSIKNSIKMLSPDGVLYNQSFYNDYKTSLDTLLRDVSHQEELFRKIALLNSKNYFVKIIDYNKAAELYKGITESITNLENRIESITELSKRATVRKEIPSKTMNETSTREHVKWITKSNTINKDRNETFRSNFEINITEHLVKHTIQGKSTNYNILVKASTKSQEKAGEFSFTSETPDGMKYLLVINKTKKTIMIIESTGETELNGYLYHLAGDIQITE